MIKFPITIVVIFSFLFSSAQTSVRAFVAKNQQQVLSIQPSNEDYSDLQTIGDAIGDARIVMLGEQDHGDAPTFLAKTRLIKYLHEKKGFNVLAFEADFFGLNYGWQLVNDGRMKLNDLINKNITTLWTQCTACSDLFKSYLPNTQSSQHPLILSGFDSQMGTKYLLPILDSALRNLKLPITTLPNYSSEIVPLLSTWYNYTNDSTTTDKIISHYLEIKKELQTKLGEKDFWTVTVENLIQQNLQFRNWKKDYWKDMNTRDRQMAANLKWLALNKYPSEKIIVWAHNYHVSKYAGHYPEDFMNNIMSMGSAFTQDSSLMKQTYVIGFSCYEGTAGRLSEKPYRVSKPKSNSFETWINPQFEYAFVDFRKYDETDSNDEMFFMSGSIKGNNHHTTHKAEWNRIFDGVFFIRNMYACERMNFASTSTR